MTLDIPIPAELRERNRRLAEESKARLGEKWCLHKANRPQPKRQQPLLGRSVQR